MQASNWSMVLMTSIIVDANKKNISETLTNNSTVGSTDNVTTSIKPETTASSSISSLTESSLFSILSSNTFSNNFQNTELENFINENKTCECDYFNNQFSFLVDFKQPYKWWIPPLTPDVNITVLYWSILSHQPHLGSHYNYKMQA